MIRTAVLAALAFACVVSSANARSLHPAKVSQATVSEVIGGRPPGCPHAYCGCGASLYLFGRIIPALNRAANWFRFPRAEPAPGMVAVHRHHVFVLKHQIGGDTWMTFDANSGHHLTRVHARSIAGWTIVDPHG